MPGWHGFPCRYQGRLKQYDLSDHEQEYLSVGAQKKMEDRIPSSILYAIRRARYRIFLIRPDVNVSEQYFRRAPDLEKARRSP